MDATKHPVGWTAGFFLLLGTLLPGMPDATIAQNPSPRRVTPKATGRPASQPARQQAGAPKRLPRSRLQSPDLRVQAIDCKISRIDGVLYTHDHADHTHGIDDLRFSSESR